VTKSDPCRFCRIYGVSLLLVAALMAAATALQFAVGLGKFGGIEYAFRAVALSAVRSVAPAAAGSALLLAFVLWAEKQSPAQLKLDFERVLRRALWVSLPGFLVAALAALVMGALMLVVFGQKLSQLLPGLGLLEPTDWVAGALSTVVDSGLISFLARRFLPRLHQSGFSLPLKLVLVITVSVPLRASVALMLASVLPS
jgi:hypothetical protein